MILFINLVRRKLILVVELSSECGAEINFSVLFQLTCFVLALVSVQS